MPTTTPVRDVMTTSVRTLRPDRPFGEAADVLAQHRIGAARMHDRDVTHILVLDADRHLVGILARGDVVQRVAADQ